MGGGGGELVFGLWWHINPHIAYKKLMLQGYFLTRDHFYICDKLKLAQGSTEKDEVYLCGYLSRLVRNEMAVTFLGPRVPKKQVECSRTYSRVLSPSTSGSGLPYPIPPCTSLYPVPARPTWPFQSPHGSEIQILRFWQSQYPADQRPGP